MSTIIWIAMGVTIGLVPPWLALRQKRTLVESPPEIRRLAARLSNRIFREPDSFDAVTISPCLGSCASAMSQQGQRYLSCEAPELPLPDCDAGQCHCRYQRYKDRRGNDDRRLGFGQYSDLNLRSGENDRRSIADGDRRRKPMAESDEPSAYFNNY